MLVADAQGLRRFPVTFPICFPQWPKGFPHKLGKQSLTFPQSTLKHSLKLPKSPSDLGSAGDLSPMVVAIARMPLFALRICCSSGMFLQSGGYWEDLDPVGYEDRGAVRIRFD